MDRHLQLTYNPVPVSERDLGCKQRATLCFLTIKVIYFFFVNLCEPQRSADNRRLGGNGPEPAPALGQQSPAASAAGRQLATVSERITTAGEGNRAPKVTFLGQLQKQNKRAPSRAGTKPGVNGHGS